MSTDTDRHLLEVAGRFYRQPGSREQAIRDEFGMSETRFWQRVNTLLDDPEALAARPVLVHRLRRIRSAKEH